MVTCICIYKAVHSDPKSNTLEHFRPQHYRPAPACIIAQQYSPTPYVSLHLHYCKEKFGARFKNVIIYFTFLKLRNPEIA
jgi:hypothetical protein